MSNNKFKVGERVGVLIDSNEIVLGRIKKVCSNILEELYLIECRNKNHKTILINKNAEELEISNNSYFPCYRLKNNIASSIFHHIENNNGKKIRISMKVLPYTIYELKVYLENQFEHWMNWDNWGTLRRVNIEEQIWQIDHIIPHSKLPYKSTQEDNFKKCWALNNLRPLSALENFRKGNKIL